VQVYSPSFLAGKWTVNDVDFLWSRVFVIGFAVFIIWGTHLLMTKTSLGLLIRAVMQNRQMAACMGVKTQRVNMLTFAFGSGLADSPARSSARSVMSARASGRITSSTPS